MLSCLGNGEIVCVNKVCVTVMINHQDCWVGVKGSWEWLSVGGHVAH